MGDVHFFHEEHEEHEGTRRVIKSPPTPLL
jgi:hypothetical protein